MYLLWDSISRRRRFPKSRCLSARLGPKRPGGQGRGRRGKARAASGRRGSGGAGSGRRATGRRGRARAFLRSGNFADPHAGWLAYISFVGNFAANGVNDFTIFLDFLNCATAKSRIVVNTSQNVIFMQPINVFESDSNVLKTSYLLLLCFVSAISFFHFFRYTEGGLVPDHPQTGVSRAVGLPLIFHSCSFLSCLLWETRTFFAGMRTQS